MKIFIQSFSMIIALSAVSICAFADIPNKYHGDWLFSVQRTSVFPWWDQIKYPVRLSIDKNNVVFEDQEGQKCRPKIFFYDEEVDAIYFKHCQPVKSELAFPPFYKIELHGNKLEGEVWTYKLLFKINGNK